MKDVFADIEFEAGELELWRGAPQCRVSPMRWSYMFLGTAVFAAAFAWSFSETLPILFFLLESHMSPDAEAQPSLQPVFRRIFWKSHALNEEP